MRQNNFFNQEQRVLQNRYFSDEFKKKKIKELENNLVSVADICRTYSVSRTSVYRWIYKYSVMAKKQVKQVVEAKSDTQQIKALKERIKELERVVGWTKAIIVGV